MRIMVTGAGGPAAISVWKSLHFDYELYMADMDPCAPGLYLVPTKQRLILPKGDAPEFCDFVLKTCKTRNIDLLIATVDAELLPLALRREEFEAMGTTVALPHTELLRLARDKALLLEECKAVVPVPFSSIWTENIENLGIELPAFAKPRHGSGSRGLKKINIAADLDDLPKDGTFLIQEWLPGEEYSVDTYVSQKGNVLAAVPRIRMKTDSGIAITARTVVHQDVIDLAIKLAKHLDLRFVANIQFKRSVEGTPKLLEINPRFPGTLPITAAAGIDIPKLLVHDILGEAIPDTLQAFREIMAVRYWTEHFCEASEWKNLQALLQATP
ncbi:MAG: ATP-grasp domain-containing protein [Burkholderiaceae bacterium]|nr:ATP-grasp domain-containing protein [Burkholderiaceae bacterium]